MNIERGFFQDQGQTTHSCRYSPVFGSTPAAGQAPSICGYTQKYPLVSTSVFMSPGSMQKGSTHPINLLRPVSVYPKSSVDSPNSSRFGPCFTSQPFWYERPDPRKKIFRELLICQPDYVMCEYRGLVDGRASDCLVFLPANLISHGYDLLTSLCRQYVTEHFTVRYLWMTEGKRWLGGCGQGDRRIGERRGPHCRGVEVRRPTQRARGGLDFVQARSSRWACRWSWLGRVEWALNFFPES